MTGLGEDRLEGARLEVDEVTKRFGGFVAVRKVSLVAEPGCITSLIGPNGAGKTTLFHAVSGIAAADSGTVHLGGRDLAGMTP